MPFDSQRVQEVFLAVVEADDPAARDQLLDHECGADAELRRRVLTLLAAHDAPDSLLDATMERLGAATPVDMADLPAERPGATIGSYRLLEKLGEGGMGTVWAAEQTQPVKRRVALKLIKAGMDSDEVLRRFEHERQALAQMNHTNIAKVFDAGTIEDLSDNPKSKIQNPKPGRGRPFFVMELVPGAPITNHCHQQRLPLEERLRMFVSVCQAIQHAHAKGIIHRDIKPSNVLVAEEDSLPVPKVIDFGVAKALHTDLDSATVDTVVGQIVGTFEYMSPEQAELNARDVDTRADIYSLGVLLYELLTGTTPITRERLKQAAMFEALRLIREEEPPKPSTRLSESGRGATTVSTQDKIEPERLIRKVRGDLDWIVMKALEKDRDRRYQTANGLARDIERFLHDEPVEARPPSAAYKLRKFAHKNRKPLMALAAFALLLIAATAISTWQAVRATIAEQATASALALAKGAENEARQAASHALAAEEEGRKLQYTTDMQLAPFVWKDDQSTAEQLRILLAKHIPDKRAAVARPDLRGFEWYYNEHLLERSAAVFSVPDASVVDGAFTSNGQLLTLSSNGQLRRWNLDSQDEDEMSRGNLPGGPSAQALVFSSDGRLGALAEGNTVYIFDTSGRKQMLSIDSANKGARLLAFSRDGSSLVIVDNQIRWCNCLTGAVIASFNREFDRPRHLHLSADGLTLAVVGYGGWNDRCSIYRLDATAKRVALLSEFGKGTISGAALSPDGQRLVTSHWFGGSLSMYDVATGQFITRHGAAHASRISAIAFSDDGMHLASADEEGTIKIWADTPQLTSKSTALRMLKGHQGSINTIRFSMDGKRLLSCSFKRPWEHRALGDGTARVWNLESTAMAFRPLERSSHRGVARLSPDGLLIADADGRGVHLWDSATGRPVRDLPAADISAVHSLAFSPTDNRLLAVGAESPSDKSYVALWDLDAGEELARLPGATDLAGFTIESGTGAVGALAFSPDGKYLVAGFGGRIDYPASKNSSYPLKVWEVATRRLIHLLVGHTYCCSSLEFSRDGKLLASGGYDRKAMVWSTETWKSTQTLQTSKNAFVHSTAFSPDGKTLAVGDDRGQIHWWDIATGDLLETVSAHGTTVAALVFSPDGRTLASGGEDQAVRLWNVPTRRQLVQLDSGGVELGFVRTLDFSPDSKQLLAGGTGIAGFWSATPILWNDSDRAAEKLRLVLKSNADFKGRIRMFSENVRLHEALEKLDTRSRREPLRARDDRAGDDVLIAAAVAATQANWHASRQAWPEAVAAFDRLVAYDAAAPDAWLRMPGLLRLSMALVHQNRPAAAAALLEAGAIRQVEDPTVSREPALGFVDGETARLFSKLRAELEKRLADQPRNAGLLELRGQLAGQESKYERQVADYTAAINVITQQTTEAEAERDLARLHRRRGDAYFKLQKWSEAVEDYAGFTVPTTDVDLLTNRARAYEALNNWDAAAADWLRVVRQKPELAKSAYDRLIRAERWQEASQLGLILIEQKPDNSLVWLRISPVLVLAGDPTAYAEFCGRMLRQFAASENVEDQGLSTDLVNAERTVKACLLRPNVVDLGKLPAHKFTTSLDDGTVPDGFKSWGWCARALLAWRSGDARSAVKYVARSDELQPFDVTHLLNLAVLAMAQHQLRHPDEARQAFDEASQLITRLREDRGKKGDHDVLIAQILFREAEEMLGAKRNP
jgi:eukaryotic-like serine/threonine-protein kinase